MKQTIEVPREWLVRLIQLSDLVQQYQEKNPQTPRIAALVGYIDSAEILLRSVTHPEDIK